jgi:hypothetical protein
MNRCRDCKLFKSDDYAATGKCAWKPRRIPFWFYVSWPREHEGKVRCDDGKNCDAFKPK